MKITRENAKELLPFVKALAEGKMIQDKIEGLTGWVDTDEINLEFEGKKILHRIKPESEFRPFESQEDCWEEMHRHSDFGWVANKNTKSKYHINAVWDDAISLDNGEPSLHYLDAFIHYEFPDGTPFGVKKEL